MLVRVILILSLTLSVAGCDTRFNPLNWFGGDREQRIRVDPSEAAGTPSDPRGLVAEITQLSIEPTTAGAIVRATGVTASQGYYDAELVLAERDNGSIVFEFRAAPPVGTPTPGLQTIVAGVSLTNGELATVRSITVIASQNRRSISRR